MAVDWAESQGTPPCSGAAPSCPPAVRTEMAETGRSVAERGLECCFAADWGRSPWESRTAVSGGPGGCSESCLAGPMRAMLGSGRRSAAAGIADSLLGRYLKRKTRWRWKVSAANLGGSLRFYNDFAGMLQLCVGVL